MRFKTTEEAFAIYNQYAKLVGFSVRKDTYRMRTNGVRVKRRFLCSAVGERNVNNVTPRKRDIESRESKAITRGRGDVEKKDVYGVHICIGLWALSSLVT
ncbi:hypothetical protein IFM89_008812 [Coptis chinensis]|uniref:FAR1 domain-containing protein n=1 Tax=Coptis chinensis TaxID=261450 RepID=A0A835HBJ2_9MAGN|nr:hypothetical protein IFM89_008812 [Coptis chinensis]